tara:strand:- start:1562 stop:2386 length:825 start_codon:yes stop_codon:yes gene_type:complete
MFNIKAIESLDVISELKQQYFASSTAPLDGMWHFGFVPISKHFGFYENDVVVGYCCINAEGYLLQFFLSPNAAVKAAELFTLITQQNSAVLMGEIKGAFVSTAEPNYLSLCLDNASSFKVNALMYLKDPVYSLDAKAPITMDLAKPDQLATCVKFVNETIGAPKEWLSGYLGNLIQRKELFLYCSDNEILATGECRLFDEYQTNYADLGMIVAESERGRGIATQVLKALCHQANALGLKVMCSTESGNIGAQKAISRAGLFAPNRLIQFEFNHR